MNTILLIVGILVGFLIGRKTKIFKVIMPISEFEDELGELKSHDTHQCTHIFFDEEGFGIMKQKK